MILVERRANPGFSFPLTLIFLVIFAALFIIFGWIVLPIALGIFLFISASVAVYYRIKRSKNHKHRSSKEEWGIDPRQSFLNLVLYRAIFDRSEEQAKAIAEDIIKREPMDSIDNSISEIQKELIAPSLHLRDLHPYTGNPTEEEIRAFLTMVLQEIEDKHNPIRSG